LNPRPKTFRTGVYIHVPMINFAVRGSIGREAGTASLLKFHPYLNRHWVWTDPASRRPYRIRRRWIGRTAAA